MRNTHYSDAIKKRETGEMYEDVVAPDKTSRSTEQIILDKEAETAINKIIDKLPEEFKEVINLSHVDHLRDQDIAKKMDIPEGTVKSRL
jgi:RNA polymerase sigma factor (sigma-70 family)